MQKTSIKKNAVLNIIKTVMSIIFPLITYPYVANVLGVEILGQYDFAMSVASYFAMIAALGVNTYAVRECAAVRDDRSKFSELASQLLTINIVTSVAAYVLLAVCLLTISRLHSYIWLILIFSVEIFFTTIGMEWIFTANEEFAYITIRRIAFQIISLGLLFTLVKNRSDVLMYAGITAFANVGANVLNLFRIKKYGDVSLTRNPHWKTHIKPIVIIFATSLAIRIYTSSDIVMMGFFNGDHSIGLYSIAVKISNVLKPVMTAIIMVAIPRLSAYVGSEKMEEYRSLLQRIFKYLTVLVLPAVIGLMIMSDWVILLLSNKDFLEATPSLVMISASIVFSIFSVFYNNGFLIPLRLEKKYMRATVISAIVNVVLNLFLLPVYAQNGAAFTTLIAEFVSFILCWYPVRNVVNVGLFSKNSMDVLLGSSVMAAAALYLKSMLAYSKLHLFAIVIICACVYGVVLLLLRNTVLKGLLDTIKKKVYKK